MWSMDNSGGRLPPRGTGTRPPFRLLSSTLLYNKVALVRPSIGRRPSEVAEFHDPLRGPERSNRYWTTVNAAEALPERRPR